MAKSRRLLSGLILSLALAGPLQAQAPTTAIIGTPPQPGWSLLSTQQKIILAPLASDWDKLENIRRKKWLGIAERFPKMSAEEQTRVQERMHEWAKLTPEQRTKARDSYKEFNQLAPEKKQALKQKWETYSNLSEEEKKQVKQTGKLPHPVLAPASTPPNESNLAITNTSTVAPALPANTAAENSKR
jgi:hypothetical protein